jgi:methionyl-tRNA formyltransferase
LNLVDPTLLTEALDADIIIVFGASYIRKPLVELLLDRDAINIHMGVSPYYRGTACNFWPLYDGAPEYVGATIHLLSRGLDSGPMLFHALPEIGSDDVVDGFQLGMRAVKAAFDNLIPVIRSGRLHEMPRVEQDRTREIRYTRNRDFTDEIAAEYLAILPSPEALRDRIVDRRPSDFILLDP